MLRLSSTFLQSNEIPLVMKIFFLLNSFINDVHMFVAPGVCWKGEHKVYAYM